MKRTLYALALLGLASNLTHAQSNVTIYGTTDGGVRNVTNSNAAGDSKLSVGSNGIYQANRFGFMGTEDLGAEIKSNSCLKQGSTTAPAHSTTPTACCSTAVPGSAWAAPGAA